MTLDDVILLLNVDNSSNFNNGNIELEMNYPETKNYPKITLKL